ACQVAAVRVLASLLSLPWLLSLAPVRRPAPVLEPMEGRLFVGKAPDVDPVLSRKRLDVLLGDSELGGIARQRNSAELFEVIRESVLLDFEYRPRSMNRYEDLRARVLARLISVHASRPIFKEIGRAHVLTPVTVSSHM